MTLLAMRPRAHDGGLADPGEGDDGGKPTIDEPTGPALDPTPDEFDKEAEGE